MKHEILNYAEYLFSAALKKSGNLSDAEDLTQETLLAALAYQNRGGEIANMQSWLAATLNHKWADMLRRRYKLPTVSIDAVTEEPWEEELPPDKPSAEQIRREVGYLAKLQRDVIVRHYLRGQKIQTIAEELGVPKGTVLSRLSSGREQMRKGLESMEQYEKQSYTPERLEISCSGRPGLHDEPYSLVDSNLVKQNILIVAYQKPLTVVEIAKALGIPTPYIENAVEDLVAAELMCRVGNKVFTDFMITTTEQKLKSLDKELLFAEEHYREIWSCMEALFADLSRLEWYNVLSRREKIILQYYSMLDVFSSGIYSAAARIVDGKEEYPVRPDGGMWKAFGNHYPADFDYDSYRITEYAYGGRRWARWENFLDAKSIGLYVYDIPPNQNKHERGPVEIHDGDLCKLLYIVYKELSCGETGFDEMFLEDIPHLAECGVLRYEDTQNKRIPRVAVPVLEGRQFEELQGLIRTYIGRLADLLEAPFRRLFPEWKIDIPKHMEDRITEVRRYSLFWIPMAVIKKAIAEGDFLQGIDYPTPPMIFVVEELCQDQQ